MNETLVKSVERWSGKSIDYLRNTPIDEIRKDIEKETGKEMRVTGVNTSTIYVFGSRVRVVQENYMR